MDRVDPRRANGKPDRIGASCYWYSAIAKMNPQEHSTLLEIRQNIKDIHIILRGDDKGQLGLIHQVKFMWKSFWLWPLCSLSAIFGFIAHVIVVKTFH